VKWSCGRWSEELGLVRAVVLADPCLFASAFCIASKASASVITLAILIIQRSLIVSLATVISARKCCISVVANSVAVRLYCSGCEKRRIRSQI